MRGTASVMIVLTWLAIAAPAYGVLSAQGASGQRVEVSLPPDVNPDSRNRLPSITPGVHGAAAIRLHVPAASVRWESPLGRALTELAILTTAREHDQPYEWSLHEMEALAVGLDPGIIDVVRHRRRLTGLPDKAAIIIQVGREIADTHALTSSTYSRAVKLLGQNDFVGLVDLMATYSATAARLTAFNQHLPPGWKQLLPLPFTLPSDVHADSRSRLPLIRSQVQNPQANLYGRQLAPEGTGPNHIGRHAAGLASLEASLGRRLMTLAVLVTAREHDAQYDWTINEPLARKDGLDPALIDIVRHTRPLTGVPEREATLIQFGRELFATHNVSPEAYARALKIFGERDLVDVVGLMAQHAADAVLLAAFDQHLAAGELPMLPVTGGVR
jgi:4-carboxymuconolactone decarboxylase